MALRLRSQHVSMPSALWNSYVEQSTTSLVALSFHTKIYHTHGNQLTYENLVGRNSKQIQSSVPLVHRLLCRRSHSMLMGAPPSAISDSRESSRSSPARNFPIFFLIRREHSKPWILKSEKKQRTMDWQSHHSWSRHPPPLPPTPPQAGRLPSLNKDISKCLVATA